MKLLTLITLASFAFIFSTQAEEVPESVSKQCKILLEATEENDLEKFESVCDEGMKEAMTTEKLKSVSDQISKLMKQGYKTDFLGSIDRITHKTYYWKLSFENKDTPEVLVQLTTGGDEVSGFFLQ